MFPSDLTILLELDIRVDPNFLTVISYTMIKNKNNFMHIALSKKFTETKLEINDHEHFYGQKYIQFLLTNIMQLCKEWMDFGFSVKARALWGTVDQLHPE